MATTTHRLTGHDAIAYAERTGSHLDKYTDPTEEHRRGLTVTEARDVATEDPSLVYVDVPTFGAELFASQAHAIELAANTATATDCPCGVWERYGWFTVSEEAPDFIDPDPTESGWRLWAVCDPDEKD